MAVVWQSVAHNAAGAASTITVTKPSGVVDGDLMLMLVQWSNTTNTFTNPAGWTQVRTDTTAIDTKPESRILYRIASSEPASYALTWANVDTIQSAIWRITGHDPVAPVNASGATTGTGNTVTAPSITTTVADTLLCYFGFTTSSTPTAFSAPSGFTQRDAYSEVPMPWELSTKDFVGPGASGSATGTITDTGSGNTIAQQVAIAPVPSVVTWQSKSNNANSNGTSIAITKPTGTANSDLLLMCISYSSNANITDPSGWTILDKQKTAGSDSFYTAQNVYWKIASSEPASYTLTSDLAISWSATIWRITGHNPTNPINVWSTATGQGASITAGSATTTYSSCLLAYFGTANNHGGAISAVTTPSGYTERNPITDGIDCFEGASKVFAGIGASGSATATTTGGTVNDYWVAHLIAIAPTSVTSDNSIGGAFTHLPPRSKLPKKGNYTGWIRSPLSIDLPGAAPVTNQIDVPTVDRRHSQIVFQGYGFSGVKDDNNPSYNMPLPWTILPPERWVRGYDFSGWHSDAGKFEWPMGGVWAEPSDFRIFLLQRDFRGHQSPGVFPDAPEEIFGKRHHDLPMYGKLDAWSREALTFTNKLPGNAANVVVPARNIFLPLVGVAAYNGGPNPPPIPTPAVPSALIFTAQPVWDYAGQHSYMGMQAYPLAADVVVTPIQNGISQTYLPYGRMYEYGGYQLPSVNSDVVIPGMFGHQQLDLPPAFYSQTYDYSGYQLSPTSSDVIIPTMFGITQMDVPARKFFPGMHNYDGAQVAPLSADAAGVTYATWNPADISSTMVLSGGNLVITKNTSGECSARATISKSAGKWYWEETVTAGTVQRTVGVGTSAASTSTNVGLDSGGWGYRVDAMKLTNNTTAAYGSTYTTGDVIGVALDLDAGTLVFYKNGVSQGTAFTGLTGPLFPMLGMYYDFSTQVETTNFGATAFAYTPPAGFNAGFYA